MPMGNVGFGAQKISEFRKTGNYDFSVKPISSAPVYSGGGRIGQKVTSAALPMPDTSDVVKSGQVVSITPYDYSKSFTEPIYHGGKVIREAGQALFIHPASGKWVPFSELPIGSDGKPQSLGQKDGIPYVNRTGKIELAAEKDPSDWIEFRENILKPAAAAAAIATGAYYAPALMSSAGAAGSAGATTAGTAAAAAPEIGAGLFTGGAEAAAAGSGGYLGGGTGGFLGFGGATSSAALPGFAAPTLGATGVGSLAALGSSIPSLSSAASALPGFTAPTLGAAGQAAATGGALSSVSNAIQGASKVLTEAPSTPAKVPEATSGLSGLMSWLGSPTGQAVSQLGSAALQGVTANRAADQQAAAAQAGIDEQRRQFNAMQAGLAPFQQAGTQALGGFAPYQQAGLQAFQQQQALAGLQGQPAQQQAISALEQSPLYQSLAKQGEEAILQRSSATGGLRGGNVQAALAQFRPAMLQQLIDQQYQRLGGFAGTGLETTAGLAKMGQSAAAMQGEGGLSAASNIGRLLAQQGQAQAGGTLGIGQGIGQALNIPSQMAGQDRANQLFDILSRMQGAAR